jgi:ABC-type cobalamin/Fe3+-siderophores transport system ATPase subunit
VNGGPVIDLEDVVVSYRDNLALRSVSLKVESGEFVGVIGPNGAGKTTLLMVIDGLTRAARGRVTVFGREVGRNDGRAFRRSIGYVAQAETIDRRMPMSVREVVMLGRYGILGLFHRPTRDDWAIVDGVIELVGMTALANRPIGQLSGGEQQRVAIARCLAQKPDLFLLDEPTASLDWRAQRELLDLVRQVHDSRGLTTLFVTHDLSALPVTCDRIVLMKEGRIIDDGAPATLLTSNSLSRLYDVPVSVVEERRARAV